jgi:hypothetical protein
MKRSKLEHSFFRRGRLGLVVAFALIIVAGVASAGPSTERIDPERSTITIHVFKSGLFRALGDNHEIQAPIKSGSVDAGMSPSVQVVVDAGRMRVLDPGSSAQDRQQVQTRMIGPEVLDANRFPEIHFESTSVDRLESGDWTVRGQLTLHGQTRPVIVKVAREQGHFRGSASFRQTDFGITPVSVGGGTVKVKDEVRIDFDVFTSQSPSGANPAR